VLIVASAVLFLLVVTRMAGLVRQEERIVDRERTLRSAGVDLVGAAGHEQIFEAAISGVRRLLGEDSTVRLALLGEEGPAVVGANGIVTYQSPSIERVLGYRADEVEGTQFGWLLSEADRPRLDQLVAGDGGGSIDAHTFECSLVHRDGTALKFEVQHTDLLQ